jgi:PTH2 family peptidyl-tRNA hydrolase
MSYKQVILVRKDLGMSKGKIAAQVAHAAVDASSRTDKKLVSAWRSEGMKKVVLKVSDEKELLDYWHMAKAAKLATALIKDAGHTQVAAGSITCLGIGPDKDEKIDKITGNLKVL